MTPQEAALWNCLLSYDYGGGRIYASDQSLAEDLGVSERYIRTLRGSMKRKGFLLWDPHAQDKRKNSYTLLAPDVKPPTSTHDKKSRNNRSSKTTESRNHSSANSRNHSSDQEDYKEQPAATPPRRRVSPSQVSTLIDCFCEHYLIATQQTYSPQSADTRAARSILATLPLHKILPHIPLFLDDTHPLVHIDPSLRLFSHWLDTHMSPHPSIPTDVPIDNPSTNNDDGSIIHVEG
jgi:hypothetical protein